MDFKLKVASAAAWIAANPTLSILIFLGLMNVVMAQIPKPKTATGIAIYDLVNKALFIVATHKDEPGTFTLPWLIKIFLSQPPVGPISIPSPAPLVDPKSPPAGKDGEENGPK